MCKNPRSGSVIAGQGALAYVTAATHGLEEEAGRIEEALQPELAAELKASLASDAPLLLPPTPILREDNWPLLTVSKGFFESLAAGGAHSGSLHALRAAAVFVSRCAVARIVDYISKFADF
jgi:coatomer protein complex subunit alpha (xenin)